MKTSTKRWLQLALITWACACTKRQATPPANVPVSVPEPAPAVANAPKDTSHFEDAAHRFAFDYPNAFSVAKVDERPTQDWRQQASSPGLLLARLRLPREYQPNTNFSEATLTVGMSSDAAALRVCTTEAAGGNGVQTARVTINGQSFTKLAFSDAAAGNLYETTSYRLLQGNTCYTIEHTIHSTNLGNYSPDQGVTAFDRGKIVALLESVVQSFQLAPTR